MPTFSFVTHKEGEKIVVIAINDDNLSHVALDGNTLAIFCGEARIAYLSYYPHSVVSITGGLGAVVDEIERRQADKPVPA
jgi:hypothetical protein